MNRGKIWRVITNWTSPLLFVLMALQLITGLASIKGREFAVVSLGFINPAVTGKLHTVWLVLVTGILVYLHGTAGLGILITRARFIRRKLAWEIVAIVVGDALFTQFLVLYFLY